MRELFVYYRIRPEAAADAAAAVTAWQARLRERHPGLTTRLLQRPPFERGDGASPTWLEIYAMGAAAAPAGLGLALQAEIEAEAAAVLGDRLQGPRQVEVFEPVRP